MRIFHFFKQDAAPSPLFPEILDIRRNGAFDNIIPQNYTHRPAIGEKFGQGKRRGNSSFPFLIGIVDMVQSELFPVAEKPKKITRVFASCHNQDFSDPGIHKRFNGIVNHRLVINRQEMLIGDLGERVEAGSKPTG